jgi:hypothetical protein
MSTVILDTITGKSTATTITIGSTPVVSASANSMTIRGEGSAQTSIQQGLAKSWINFNGSGTIASRDTHNVASIVDNGTGSFAVNFTSALGDTNYSTITAGNQGASALDARQGPGAIAQSTSQVGIYCGFDNGAGTDWSFVYDAVFGDLA